MDNANVGMSEKILQKSCRQKKQAASKKDIACFLFHVSDYTMKIDFCFDNNLVKRLEAICQNILGKT